MHIRSADLVAWLRTRVTATGAHGLIVPLSDSLQAAVVARLCQQAVREAVLGALLPSGAEERARAGALAQQLQLPIVDVESRTTAPLADELSVQVERVRQRREPLPDAAATRDALATRVCMAKVHFVADSLNCLIAGTLDRTDMTLGAFTRYAESDVDLLPLGGVFRTDVIALARDLELPGDLADRAPMPQDLAVSHQDLERYQSDGPDGVAPAVALRIERLMRESERKRSAAEIPESD